MKAPCKVQKQSRRGIAPLAANPWLGRIRDGDAISPSPHNVTGLRGKVLSKCKLVGGGQCFKPHENRAP
jgi:hypothetical protein